MGAEWREISGRKYVYVDFRGCTNEDELLEVYRQEQRLTRTRPTRSLLLMNFEGVSVGSKFMSELQKGGETHGADVVEKAALVGITGLKQVLVNTYGTLTRLGDRIRTFEDEAAALRWLLE